MDLRPAGFSVRLNGTRTARLDPPDDMLFQALLAKLFADRQLFPPLSIPLFVIAVRAVL